MSSRTAMIAAGVVLVLGGGVAAAGGTAGLVALGTDGTLESGRSSLASRTTALVTDEAYINHLDTHLLGHPSVTLSVRGSGRPVFVGVGPAAAVDRYLAGAEVETVTDLEVRPLRLTTTVHHGATRPAPPADQTFWVAQADGGSAAATTWPIHDGRYRVVVMNADGSPGIRVDGEVGLRAAWLTPVVWSVLGGGLAVLLLGLTLLLLGLRSVTRPDRVAAAPSYQTVGL
jgi:hypothetical protein